MIVRVATATTPTPERLVNNAAGNCRRRGVARAPPLLPPILMSTSPLPTPSVVPTLTLVALAGTMAIMSFAAVIGPVARVLGLQEWHIGLALTASGLLWMASARRWGLRSDRVGRKPVLMAALAGFAVVYLAMTLFIDSALRAPPWVWLSVLVLVFTRGVEGLFYAAVPSTAAALIADEAPPEQRASLMARLGSANAIGMVAGPAVAGWIASYNLALALYAALALPLLALLVVWLKLPAAPPRGAGARPKAPPAWRDPRLRLPLLTVLTAMLTVTISQVVVGFFAIDRLQLTPTAGARAAGLTLGALGIGLMAAQALVMACRSVSPRRWIALGAVIAALGFGGMVAVTQQWQMLAAYAVGAFGMGFIMPSFPALASNAVGRHEQGAAQGTVAAAQGLGMVVGPLAGTVLYKGSPNAPYVLLALALLALAITAAAHPAPDRAGA